MDVADRAVMSLLARWREPAVLAYEGEMPWQECRCVSPRNAIAEPMQP